MIATPEVSAGHRRQLRGCLGARARTLVEIMWMLNTHRNPSTFCNCLHRHDSFFLCADAMQVQSSEALYQSKMHHKSFGGGLRQDPLAVFKRSIDPSRGQRRSGNKGWGKGRRKKKEGREGREEGKKAKKRGRCGPFFKSWRLALVLLGTSDHGSLPKTAPPAEVWSCAVNHRSGSSPNLL